MATIIVTSTQGKDQMLTDFPTGNYSPEEFNKALNEAGVNTSGMSITAQDLDDVEDIMTVRSHEGHWEDEIDVTEGSRFIVGLNPKSTSNG